ncbi:MAG: SDR family oxidoreductase [Planctomycetaceae bacterium]|nr:SDR family oxidoreductase [Planctomycetales bacterium]MCB9927621.1 SDR family oxidoreductase [Planctomycetaceae bacterium]
MTGGRQRLIGKTAIVTGAGRGIGRAIAVALASEGANLCIVSRTRPQLDCVAAEIRQLGAKVLVVECDVTDLSSVESAVAETAAEFGRIDILVNNAGGGEERKTVGEDDPEVWRAVVELNLMGTYYFSRSVVPHLRDAGGGAIINVGSGMGHQPRAGNSSYNAAKAGVWMLTRCMAMELADQSIAVNELVPGPVATELTAAIFKAQSPHPTIPGEWVKSPEEVSSLAIFLATQGPKGPTGQSFSLARRPL